MSALARQPGRQVRRGVVERADGIRGAGVTTSRCLGRPCPRLARRCLRPRRDFIEKRYVELKKANPELPILIRECSDVQPKLWARYGERRGPGPGTRVGNESWPGGAAPRLSERGLELGHCLCPLTGLSVKLRLARFWNALYSRPRPSGGWCRADRSC